MYLISPNKKWAPDQRGQLASQTAQVHKHVCFITKAEGHPWCGLTVEDGVFFPFSFFDVLIICSVGSINGQYDKIIKEQM